MQLNYKKSISLPSLDWLLGVLVAIPFTYPKEPLYWLGLIAFLIIIPRFIYNKQFINCLITITALICVILVSNITTAYIDNIYIFSIVGTIFTLLMFFFRFGVDSYSKFIDGYLFVISIYVFLTFIFFFILKPYTLGFDFFINSYSRMWAEGYLIEWPNVFCVFLVMGAFSFLIKGRTFLFWVTMFAAVLTTSRMAILALILYFVFYICKKISVWRFVVILIVLAFSLITYFYILNDDTFNQYLSKRLFKTSDRLLILNSLLEVFVDNIFGVGNVPFSIINPTYESYHSSFLKVLVRYGFLGFILFVILVIPSKPLHKIFLKRIYQYYFCY